MTLRGACYAAIALVCSSLGVPTGADRNGELKRRIRLRERGDVDDLAPRVAGQQVCSGSRSRPNHPDENPDADEEKRGRRARVQTAIGSKGKAMKGLIGGVAGGNADERRQWTNALILRSEESTRAHPDDNERAGAAATAWGNGNFRDALAAMRQV